MKPDDFFGSNIPFVYTVSPKDCAQLVSHSSNESNAGGEGGEVSQ
jgi:hypothetical protein